MRVLQSGVTSEVIDLEILGQLLVSKVSNKSDEELRFFNDYIDGKNLEQIVNTLERKIEMEKIVELLLVEETSDNGGIVALSGFYFQFMVSIEYLVDLIKGKWDYLLIDHHQDIVAISKDQVRVIQVKTKNVSYCDVSETDLYSKWIQKLFVMDKMFNSFTSTTEFELVTNFLIKNSPTVEVEIYHHNTEFNMKIEKNSFFDKVKHYNEQNNYTDLLDDGYLEELLSRFKISKKNPEDYLDKVCSRIGSLFNERFKSTKEDIDFLIGYICSMCYYPENPSFQLINYEKGMQIKEALRGRFEGEVRQHMEKEDSITKINNYILFLQQTFSQSPFYQELSFHINEFDQELKECIIGSNNIYSILSRFVERVYSSPNFDTIATNTSIDELIKQLLDITFLVKMSAGGKVIIDAKHSRFLLKIIGNQKYNFFNLNDLDNYEDGIRKFNEIFKLCNYDEKRMAIGNNDLKLILSGDFEDEEFPEEHFIELDFIDAPTEKDMENISIDFSKDSIAKVTYKVQVVNGSNNIKRDLLRKRKLPSLIKYEEYIRTKMG